MHLFIIYWWFDFSVKEMVVYAINPIKGSIPEDHHTTADLNCISNEQS